MAASLTTRTGRQLDSLHNTFSRVDLFDRVVAENGALLFTPATGKSRCLAPQPPAAMLDALHKRNVPMVVGRSIVATVEPYEHAVLSVIRELGLEWHVIFNKGNVMVLPSGVTKATGLVPTLAELGVTAEETIGVGDAENDHVFLGMCGLAVAVANALPSLKEEAHVVTAGARGDGFIELTNELLARAHV
jgi:hydroxymethylpyrimidine pyrophosphatase-like HAD family hydrolase